MLARKTRPVLARKVSYFNEFSTVNVSENWLNVSLAGICTRKNLTENYTCTTAINGKNENCRDWPNVFTKFVLT